MALVKSNQKYDSLFEGAHTKKYFHGSTLLIRTASKRPLKSIEHGSKKEGRFLL